MIRFLSFLAEGTMQSTGSEGQRHATIYFSKTGIDTQKEPGKQYILNTAPRKHPGNNKGDIINVSRVEKINNEWHAHGTNQRTGKKVAIPIKHFKKRTDLRKENKGISYENNLKSTMRHALDPSAKQTAEYKGGTVDLPLINKKTGKSVGIELKKTGNNKIAYGSFSYNPELKKWEVSKKSLNSLTPHALHTVLSHRVAGPDGVERSLLDHINHPVYGWGTQEEFRKRASGLGIKTSTRSSSEAASKILRDKGNAFYHSEKYGTYRTTEEDKDKTGAPSLNNVQTHVTARRREGNGIFELHMHPEQKSTVSLDNEQHRKNFLKALGHEA
jgi:hypothetical protein